MKYRTIFLLLSGLVVASTGAYAVTNSTIDQLLQRYQTETQQPFSADRGEKMWSTPYQKDRSCNQCHTDNLRQMGQHATTKKPIQPMSPTVNPDRLQDSAKVEKWFGRNCRWTMGRECTAQEKGDFLLFINR